MMTNRTTVTIKYILKYYDIQHVVSEIFNVEKCRDLENGVRGHSRSLKVVPFGTTYLN